MKASYKDFLKKPSSGHIYFDAYETIYGFSAAAEKLENIRTEGGKCIKIS